jgi:hypothetical protein
MVHNHEHLIKPEESNQRSSFLALDKVTKERDHYKLQLAEEISDKDLEGYNTWAMSESQLEDANEMLGLGGYRKLDVGELKEIALDVYQQPTKYIDAIKQYRRDKPELTNY